LERVISHSHYLIPQWTTTSYRMAYSGRLGKPATMPFYAQAETWAIATWWVR
jgi:microcin C transport system substrate-binding protein